AIRRFALQNDQVAEVLSKWVADFRADDAAAMAAFSVDAIAVRPQLLWQLSSELARLGRGADFLTIGYPVEGIDELVTVVASNLDHLNHLRAEHLLRKSKKG